MISGDNPPKYCRWCGVRMPAPGMHEGSFKSETDCELEAVKSKLATTELMLAQRNEQIAARIRELAAAEQGWNKCDDAWEAEVKGMEAENAALQSRLDRIRVACGGAVTAPVGAGLYASGYRDSAARILNMMDDQERVVETCSHARIERRGDGRRWCLDCKTELPRASVVERQVLKDGDLVEFEGKRYVLTDVERQLPECRNCGTPSKALTNGWCDGCMGMAIV
jgi:hypothetical protein